LALTRWNAFHTSCLWIAYGRVMGTDSSCLRTVLPWRTTATRASPATRRSAPTPCPSPFLLRTLQVSPTLVSGEIGAIHVTLDRTGAPTRNHARSVWRSGDGSPVRLLLEGRIGDSRPA